nr:hypothetical protein L203_06612 [Cryptococcus depauperatus CBS 7841]
MSLRPLIRKPLATTSSRTLINSVARRTEHTHSGNGTEDQSDAYTTETFFSPSWRNAFLFFTASLLIYPYLSSPSTKPISPSLDPEAFEEARKDQSLPALTRWLANQISKAEVWKKRNDKHLELSKEAAETKLLFQEAERPRIWRMRYPSSFEQASPYNIPVGSQIDLSDLKVQPAK